MSRIRDFVELIDRRPQLLLPLWIGTFFAVMWTAAARPLFYDELCTYYIAMSPTWERYFESVRTVDLQPPLNFALVRLSVMAFGDSALSARLPSMLSFVVASLVMARLVFRRLGGVSAVLSVSILWCLWGVEYAAVARPYSLILALVSCCLFCWTSAIGLSRWTAWHSGLAASLTALFLTHCFAPLFGAAIGVGEVARTIRTRKVDVRIWVAILVPLLVLPTYIPLLQNAQSIQFLLLYQVSALTIPVFYLVLVAPMLVPVAMAALYRRVIKSTAERAWSEIGRLHELAFVLAAIACPIVIVCYCAISGVAFYNRYGIVATLGVALITVALLAKWIVDRRVALLAAAVLLGVFSWNRGFTGALTANFVEATFEYRSIRKDLPFVTASGLTFLEMDKREPPEVAQRLFYLTNNEAALRYIHANMFEGLAKVQRVFPIRGKVLAYDQFVKNHSRFLVFAMPEDPENWLLPKLKDDGAQITLLHEEKATGYLDRRVYGVEFKR